jgi:hypothetical protein
MESEVSPPSPPKAEDAPQSGSAADTPKQTGAVCPYCGADPFRFAYATSIGSDGMIMQLVWCANEACRKTISVGAIGRVEVPSGGRILRP